MPVVLAGRERPTYSHAARPPRAECVVQQELDHIVFGEKLRDSRQLVRADLLAGLVHLVLVFLLPELTTPAQAVVGRENLSRQRRQDSLQGLLVLGGKGGGEPSPDGPYARDHRQAAWPWPEAGPAARARARSCFRTARAYRQPTGLAPLKPLLRPGRGHRRPPVPTGCATACSKGASDISP